MPSPLERSCRICGCTDDRACQPFGCYWVEPDLCSACDDDPEPGDRAPMPRAPAETVLQCVGVDLDGLGCCGGLRHAA